MERLDFSENTAYDAMEACIHLNRYAFVKPFCEGADILDAACGQGYGSYLMKTWGAKSVTGIDIDQETVEKASRLFQQDGLCYMQHTVEQLPFPDASFDVVVSFETIEHVDDPDAFLEEIKRVLKPGGTVIISCPNDNYYYQNDCAKNPFHKAEYTYFQFKEMAEKHLGNEAEYFFSFALDGFVNLPADKCTEPELSEPETALGLFHHEACSSALCVPQERYLNKWNANYYIGVWGKKENLYRISTVFAPRETFIQHKDEDFDFLAHVDKLQNEVTKLTEKREQAETDLLQLYRERDALKEVRRNLEEENVRLTNLLDIARKEEEQLKCHFQHELSTLKKEHTLLLQEMDGQRMATARLTDLLALTKQERNQLQEWAQSLSGQLADAQGERDWLRSRWESLFFIRAKRLLVRILRKVKRILGRGN